MKDYIFYHFPTYLESSDVWRTLELAFARLHISSRTKVVVLVKIAEFELNREVSNSFLLYSTIHVRVGSFQELYSCSHKIRSEKKKVPRMQYGVDLTTFERFTEKKTIRNPGNDDHDFGAAV